MKRGVWALAAWLAMAVPAVAEQWTDTAETTEGDVYAIDLSSVSRDGAIAKSWFRETLKKPRQNKSAGRDYAESVMERFDDCEHRRFQIGVYVERDAHGGMVATGSSLARGWQEIVPGSIAESAYLTACALASPPQEKPFAPDIGAGSWTDLGASANGRYRLKVRLDDVVKLKSGYVAALMRSDYVNIQDIDGYPVRYVVTADVIECATGKAATLGGDFYLSVAARLVAKRTPYEKLDFRPSPPGSFIANSLGVICGSAKEVEARDNGEAPHEGGFSVGTAWGVSKGYLVTAAHVVAGGRRIFVYDNGERVGEARVVAGDPANDLAVLKFTPARPGKIHILPIALKAAALGRSIFVLGYPAPDVMGQHIKMTAGQVSSTAGMEDDARFLQISAPVQPGNSGGPVIGWDGSVVGVVESGLTRLGDGKDEPAPQNVNYALKASYVRPMLDDLPDLANYVAVKPAADHDQMVAEARKAVFMVVVTP